MRLMLIAAALVLLGAAGCRRPVVPEGAEPTATSDEAYQVGKASYYGGKFHGRKTASGERFNQHAMTAAHRKLSFGTVVRVTNLSNGRSVEVRINDRGPFGNRGRIIDVSRAAARKLGMIADGVVRVRLDIVERP